MAPTLPGARKKRATQVKLLDNTIRKLAEACAEADPPSNTAIIRLIAAVDQQYEKVQQAHDDVVSLLEDADDEAEDAVLVGIDTGVSAAKEIAHRVIDARHTGSGGDSERAPRSPSGTSTGGRSHMSMDQRLAILLGSRDGLTVRIEQAVDSLEAVAHTEFTSTESVDGQKREIDHVVKMMDELDVATGELTEVDPEEFARYQAYARERRSECTPRLRVIGQRLDVAKGKLPSRNLPAGGGVRQVQKFAPVKLPEFGGERREYPGFRRDWREAVEGQIDPVSELRQFKDVVPAVLKNEIKNFRTMKECWETLDAKFADSLIGVSEYLGSLEQFAFSKSGLSPHQKFLELFAIWRRVLADLTEIGKIDALSNPTVLMRMIGKLPTEAQQTKFIQLRIRRQEENGARGQLGQPLHTELGIVTEFMNGEKRIMDQWALLRPSRAASEASGGTTDNRRKDKPKEKPACFTCGSTAHRAADCREGKPRGLSTKYANANMALKPKACPACQSVHTFDSPDGTLLYRNRLSCCPAFTALSVLERAQMVENSRACALCLDWTATHQRTECREKIKGQPYKVCPELVGGVQCGKKHHKLLHGAVNRYTNYVIVNSVSRPVPTADDLARGERAVTLLPVERIKVDCDGDVSEATGFWDGGSNLNLVRQEFARRAGWTGHPVSLSIQTTGRNAEEWHTLCYYIPVIEKSGKTHFLMAFEMEQITAPLDPVDLSTVVSLFDGLSLEEVERPVGHIDLLIGIQDAGLFPICKHRLRDTRGHLRVLSSLFGTGRVMDGSHPGINGSPLMQTEECHHISRSRIAGPSTVTGEPTSSYGFGQPAVLNRVFGRKFDFLENEELGVAQPRRCESCGTCRKCSEQGYTTTRREQEELSLIRRGMSLDSVEHVVRFTYPTLQDPHLLTDNRGQATAMALGLERKLRKRGQLEAYNKEVKGYVDSGVFRALTQEEMDTWAAEGRAYSYISHHGVEKDGATTALRIVANSSLDVNNSGLSLNGLLPKGPNSLVSLLKTSMRFRAGEHVAVWDLTKAYTTVRTGPEELHLRRLVWRDGNPSEAWTTYGIQTMYFGDRPAAAGLENARCLVADAGRHIDPEAARMIEIGYVDDGVGGGDLATIDRLVGTESWLDGRPTYSGTVAKILALGSFKVKVMVRDGETRQDVLQLLGGGVLGLDWNPGSDIITMHLGVNLHTKTQGGVRGPEVSSADLFKIDCTQMTRRLVLSCVYSVYDPLGLIAPLLIRYKLLLQRLAVEPGGWDDELDDELAQESRDILKQMVCAEDIVFPRSTKPPGTVGPPQLVAFWDGGDPASAAVVYVRYELAEPTEGGDTHVMTIMLAKARVTPSGGSSCSRSTPRSEMRGLLMAGRMLTVCNLALEGDKPDRIMIFGDSQCTISSVDTMDGVLKPWFGNRVHEFHENRRLWEASGVKVDDLHHWPGLRNIADLATKGKAEVSDVAKGSEWQDGPVECRKPRETWPATRDFKRQLPDGEVRLESGGFTLNAVAATVIEFKLFHIVREIMDKSNDLRTVKGILARFLGASSSRVRADILVGPTVRLLTAASALLFMTSAEAVDAEVKKGALDGLAPVWSRGRWVTRGRLSNGLFSVLGVSELAILLPEQRLAYLIMAKAHKQDHRGPTITLWRSRAEVWIVRGRRLADKIEKSCVLCRARKAHLTDQRMGQLPLERIAYQSRPWDAICLDFFGPILTKAMNNARSMLKCWGLLIVCQATGAVHVELTYSYSTDAFLNAWQRFTAVRGVPRKVVSDKGSQLTSCRNTVAFTDANSPKACDWARIKEAGARAGTSWEYVPAGCQFRNGLAEARVKAVKHAMDHMVNASIAGGVKPSLNYAQLATLVAVAANAVNDRPIGVKKMTESDFVPLTVNMLLLGRTSTAEIDVLEGEVEEADGLQLNEHQNRLFRTWWKHWKIHGFHALLPFSRLKHGKRHKNLEVDDICLVQYDNAMACTYRMCRVLEVIVSQHDDCVRTVVVGLQQKDKRRRGVSGGRRASRPLVRLEVAVQRLVLLLPREEQEALKTGCEKQTDTADIVTTQEEKKDMKNIEIAEPVIKTTRSSADAQLLRDEFVKLALGQSDESGGRRTRSGACFTAEFIKKTDLETDVPDASMMEVSDQDVSADSDVIEEANLMAEMDAFDEQEVLEEEEKSEYEYGGEAR